MIERALEGRGRALCWHAAILAVALTALNALKPPVIDDTALWLHARHIAADFSDPYAGEVYWHNAPEPTMHLAVQPVSGYWWALGMRLLGDDWTLWKIWLLPWAAALTAGLAMLWGRFAPRFAAPLLWLVVLSPTILPGFNFMLDVPALALSVLAVATFIRGVERDSWPTVIVAGLLGGLATQTKFTALGAPGAMLAWALVQRRWKFGIVAGALAAVVFVGTEAAIWSRYGTSPFLYGAQYTRGHGFERDLYSMLKGLAQILGATSAALVPLLFIAFEAKRRVIGGILMGILAAYALLLVSPSEGTEIRIAGRERLFMGQLAVSAVGLLLWVGIGVLILRESRRLGSSWRTRRQRMLMFLLLWLAVELTGYFVLSPMPATRRVMRIAVVLALLAAWALQRAVRDRAELRPLVWTTAALGVLLGLGFWTIDLVEARNDRQAMADALALVRTRGGGPAWYIGHWAWQYHAERAGLRAAVPDRSRLKRGDWLIVPSDNVDKPGIVIDPSAVEKATHFPSGTRLPLTLRPNYYVGRQALIRVPDNRVWVTVYRVRAEEWIPPLKRRG